MAATVVVALGAVFAIAAPANAADVDPGPARVISGLPNGNPAGLVVAPDGTTYASVINSVFVFAPGATDGTTPEFDITGLDGPTGLALDSAGDLWVADQGDNGQSNGAVLEFAPGANENATPLLTISGPETGLTNPADVAIGADGSVYVVNNDDSGSDVGNDFVYVYANGASDALDNDAPIQELSGANTGFQTLKPLDIALQSDGSIVVGGDGPAIETFAAGLFGDVAPIRTIAGTNTQLSEFGDDLAIDSAGDIFWAGYLSNSVIEFAESANGDAAPINRITGANSTVDKPYPLAFDSHDNLYVGDDTPGSVAVFSPVLGISPASGSSSGGETATIHGYDFVAGSAVTFDGIPATDVQVVSSSEITAVVPAHVAGAVDVTVTAADGSPVGTLAKGFSFVPTLATTGVDPTPAIVIASILLAIGAVLLFMRRRLARAARAARRH